MSENLLLKIIGKLDKQSSDIGQIKTDMTTLKGDVTVLKEDVTRLSGDVTILKDDMMTLKGDVTVLKDDMTSLKIDVKMLKSGQSELNRIVFALRERQEETDAKLDSSHESIFKRFDQIDRNMRFLESDFDLVWEHSNRNQKEINRMKQL